MTERIEGLRTTIDAAAKSMRWRTRARVGDRMVWYEMPQEPDTEAFQVR